MFSVAHAQDAAAAAAPAGVFGSFLPLILIFVVFYFFMIRPQARRAKEHREMLANLRRGDRVQTQGGLFGTVDKINDDSVVLLIAEKTAAEFNKQALVAVVEKAPVVEKKPAAKKKSAAKKAPAKKTSAKKAKK